MLKNDEVIYKNGIPPSLNQKLQKWLSGNHKKPQGGRLRPIIQGKTVAQRVLEDRGK
jgi:hypothetical protein